MGKVVTFYSYKGGVGRSMALVNTGVLLARWGYRVLLVDWDLEAPGLEGFFRDQISTELLATRRGVLDLLEGGGEQASVVAERSWWWQEVFPLHFSEQAGQLYLFTAGRRDANYFKRLRRLDLGELYLRRRGGEMIESLREAWKREFDFVLIDSRTGLTDLGGICTAQMPDLMVLLFTATESSLRGVVDVASKANFARQKLPFDRPWISSLPIASRFDRQTEYRLAEHWLDRFAEELRPLFEDWLPKDLPRRQLIEASKLPHVGYFSFGEKIAVAEENADDPASLAFAYEGLAALVAQQLENIAQFIDNRQAYVRGAAKSPDYFDVFLSYPSQERGRVEPLAAEIREAGFKVFFDQWDLLPGMPWQKQLEDAIARSRTVFLFLGAEGLGAWQAAELQSVVSKNVKARIVPVLLPGFEAKKMPEALRQVQPRVELGSGGHGARQLIELL